MRILAALLVLALWAVRLGQPSDAPIATCPRALTVIEYRTDYAQSYWRADTVQVPPLHSDDFCNNR